MAVLQRDQLLAARPHAAGGSMEAGQLPKARIVPETLRTSRGTPKTMGPTEPAKPEEEKGALKDAKHFQKSEEEASAANSHDFEEVHTPTARTKHLQAFLNEQTPEKCERPKMEQKLEPCGKVIYKPLNAYASEFVPGQPVSTQESFFASVVGLLAAYQEDESKLYMPPVLPAVPLADIAVMSAWARSMEAIYKDPFGSAKLLQTLFPAAAHVPPASEVSPYVPPTDVDTSTARLLTVTACLLNFFFQNHILQTTPIVLEIIEKKLEGRWTKSGPWRKTLLQQVAFELDDLAKLDHRLATLLNKVPKELLPRLTSAVHGLNLRWAAPGRWLFEDAPELRCMVPGRPGHADFAVLALSFQREEGQLSPSQTSMERFFRLHPPGVACFQGLDTKAEEEVANSLVGKGYDTRSARSMGSANTIAWDRKLWTFVAAHEEGSAIAVDLALKGGASVRFACLRPTLAECGSQNLRDLLRSSSTVVVCADLSMVGGATAAALVPGIAGLRSAMYEVLGQEVAVPLPRAERAPLRMNPAAGLLQPLQDLWQPSGMYISGLEPVSALSEHSEGYLATMSDQDVRAAFPGGQAPLLAEMQLAGK